jgi:hypothetical protein
MRKIFLGLLLFIFLLGCTSVGTDFLKDYRHLALSTPEVYGAGLAFEGEPLTSNLHDGFEQTWRGEGEDELRIEYRIVLDEQNKEDLKWQKDELNRQEYEQLYQTGEREFAYCKQISENFVICHLVHDFYHVSFYLVKENTTGLQEKAAGLMARVKDKIG